MGRKRAVYPALIGIAAFATLVGGNAAVMRGALMGGFFVWAMACLIMTLVNPFTLWDVGFQMGEFTLPATGGRYGLARRSAN